jgi:hypothetical protein
MKPVKESLALQSKSLNFLLETRLVIILSYIFQLVTILAAVLVCQEGSLFLCMEREVT